MRKISGELSLETNENAYVDGGIATMVSSSPSIPVAIDTSGTLHAARIKRFKSNACTGVIAGFTSCTTNSVMSHGNSNGLQADIVQKLKEMLDENNTLVQSFRMARDKIQQCNETNVKLNLIGRRDKDGRMYNLPTASEVATLVVGDFDDALGNRDIIVETKTGYLKRINELHASYLGLEYPLIFPYGEDGYREDISLSITTSTAQNKRKRVSTRQFFAYRFHDRDGEECVILSSRRLTQRLIVDSYTIIESGRLTWVNLNQKTLRCEIYKGLGAAFSRGETNLATQGLPVVFPSSYTGSPRYMIQNFQDAMTICGWAGCPD
ncbi:hypothetical protein OROMI_020614 [Orobanche minor]